MSALSTVRPWPLPTYLGAMAALQSVAELAWKERRLAVLTGAAGSGKTRVATDFAGHDETARAFYCAVPPRDRLTPVSLLTEIGRAAGQELRGGVGWCFDQLRYVLEHSGRILILDEADRLRRTNMDLVRDLSECSQAPIVLAGCPRLLGLVEKVSPVASRVCLVHSIRPVQLEDVLPVLGHSSGFAQEHGLHTWDEQVLATAVSEAKGNLRGLQILLQQLEAAETDARPINGASSKLQQAIVQRVARERLLLAS